MSKKNILSNETNWEVFFAAFLMVLVGFTISVGIYESDNQIEVLKEKHCFDADQNTYLHFIKNPEAKCLEAGFDSYQASTSSCINESTTRVKVKELSKK